MSTQGKVAVGHPVDVATGTMFNDWVDFGVPGVIPLSFVRFYSTALASRRARGPLGLGWRHGFQYELRQTVEGFAYVDSEGAEIAIEDLDGEFAKHGRLVVPRDQIELRGTTEEVEVVPYGPGQALTFWFKRCRGTTQYALRALGRNPSLRLELQHDAQGRLVRVLQRRSGRCLSMEHDARDRLAAVWFEAEGRRELAVRLKYDADDHLIAVNDRLGQTCRYEYDRAGLMLAEVGARGTVHTFRYDTSSRCVYASGADRYEERQLTYFPREHRTEVADSHGAVTTYRYNDAGQVVETIDPLGATDRCEYDGDGRMIGITDASGKSARMEYDRWGHLCAATYPDGKKVVTRFDDRHLPLAMSDYWGNTWRYEYDESEQLLHSVNPSGHVWSYTYNAHGEVVTVRNPLGAVAALEWDRAGNPRGFRQADGGEWIRDFDLYGRCTAERDPTGGVTRFEYDEAGILVRTVEADGRVYRSTHDAARRTVTSFEPDGRKSVTVYNACGNAVEDWLPDGSVVRYAWDTEPGRLLSVTDALGRSIRYRYDAAGWLVERFRWDGASTRYEHDPLGNLTAVVDASGGRTEFVYDDWGNLVKRIAADGAKTECAYDANALPIRVETVDAVVEFERDYYGRVLVERQNGVAVASRYDAAGHRVELRSDAGGEVQYDWTPGGNCAALSFRGRTVRFEYDLADREVVCELPGGWRLEQSHDPCGRLRSQVCTHAVRPGEASEPGRRAPILSREYRYNPGGNVDATFDSLRGTTRYVHDGLGRLHAVVHVGKRIECFGYDPAHNRSYAVRASGAAMDPLIAELTRTGAIEPRELTPGEEVERTDQGPPNAPARLTRGKKSVSYQYDALGRLARKDVADGGSSERWSYEWNASSQLVAVCRPDGARWEYRYDGLGRRIAKIAPSGERWAYVWDGIELLHVIGPGGTTTTIGHPNAEAPLIREAEGRLEYALLDGGGAVSERIDDAGTITWQSRRGTWGEPDALVDGEDGFPGQQLDAESGLYYNHHRYYDPELGRYISPDPIGLLGGLNEYAYVPSPLEWTDVLGLITGGPYDWKGASTYTGGPPDLRNEKTRFVTNPKSGRDNVVKPPGKDSLSGGQTLAVITGLGSPAAFVSGGDSKAPRKMKPTAIERLFGSKEHGGTLKGRGVGTHDMGNRYHSEIQALAWMNKPRNRRRIMAMDGNVHLWIDRPPCSHNGKCCDDAIQAFLHGSKLASKVTIHYMDQDKDGNLVWKEAVRDPTWKPSC